MRGWVLKRLAWMVLTLLGITFVTFAVLDLAPVDRAELAAARSAESGNFPDAEARETAILRLRVRYGMVDATTLQPAPMWRRYLAWLGNAVTLRFGGPNDDHAALWQRLGAALPVTALLGFLALLVGCCIGLPLGAWLGMHAGSRGDRAGSGLLLVLAGVPEYLLGTLLLLGLAGAGWQWFPASGLRSHGAEQWALPKQVIDFGWHLVLPVAVLATGPIVLVTRFLRDSVARAASMPFADNLRALGLEPALVRRRLLANGAAPLATLAGSLLPMLVGGSIVVENLFSLDGLGHLAFRAVQEQDQPMVMALVVLTSVVTLSSLLLSDVLHRLVDPRVRLPA